MRTPTAVSAGRLVRCLSLRSLAGLGRLVALLLGEAAPDAVDLPGPQRERETRGRTGQRADRPRLGRLLQRPARGRDREEQIGIGGPAGGKLPPLAVGNQPRHLGAVRGTAGRASSRRLGRGYALRAPRPTRKGVHGRVAGGVAQARRRVDAADPDGLPRRRHRHASQRNPGRWQRLAGTSTCTAVRGRSVLRCCGRANHHDPVTPRHLPRG